nr:RNA-directed DNA polymerase, eukaryota, reverse transcriptase zinc-binding domain protein [Tanacetum cinerariifolium]
MSRAQEWNEVVEKVKSRLSKWKLKALSIGGRLTLFKSVLVSIPIFYMSIYRVLSRVLNLLESIRNQFFNGNESSSKRAISIKWSSVMVDKSKGGLGVASLYALNRGLLIKWLWRFYSQKSALWVRVVKAIHEEDGKVGSKMLSSTRSCWLNIVNEIRIWSAKGIHVMDFVRHKLGNGKSTLFWEDIWFNRCMLKEEFPRLYALESSKKYDMLSELVREIVLAPISDKYNWSLEGSRNFSVASIRREIDDKLLPMVSCSTRWVKYVPIQVNIFAWKVKMNALPLRFNISRRVGGKMSRAQEWNEVVEKVKSRLSKWKLKALSIGGRLTLFKSVLVSIPIFYMSIYRVLSRVLNLLESIRNQFFNGNESSSKRAISIKWSSVMVDKSKGGLGVASLYALNRGLLIKWLWRFYSQKSALWVRVVKAIHEEDGKVGSKMLSSTRSCWLNIVNEIRIWSAKGIHVMDFVRHKLGNGKSTLFWEDIWFNRCMLKEEFPRLYALESSKKYDMLSELVREIVLAPISDKYNWSLEGSRNFSVASIRREIDDKLLPMVSCSTRWVKYVPIQVNIFAWKVKMNALPLRFNISRRGIDIGSILCPVSNCRVETSSHLFFRCSTTRRIMRKISSWWDISYVEIDSYEDWMGWLVSLRMPAKIKLMFEGVFYELWWIIWRHRNKIIFETKMPLKSIIFDDVVSSSFHWCRTRSNVMFSRDVWLKNPHLIVL